MAAKINTAAQTLEATSGYPEGAAQRRQVEQRQQRGRLWQILFLAAMLFSVMALAALLYNIIDGSFGYVIYQNEIDPRTIALEVEERQMLALPQLTASEDDTKLAEGIAANPYAIGFFGYAYYQEYQQRLKTLSVDGIPPAQATIADASYSLARPLFLYTTEELLRTKPQLADFLNYYLANVNSEIAEIGYFPAAPEELAQTQAAIAAIRQTGTETSASEGGIALAGSSTVFPLSQRMVQSYRQSGFTGAITLDNIGSKAGIAKFCQGVTDIANASRVIQRAEQELCKKAGRTPFELHIGNDALAIVVSQQNDFLQNVTRQELAKIFSGAVHWSDVNPAWPSQPIVRFVPGRDSGSLDFFVESIFDTELANLPKETLTEVLAANISKGLMRRLENDKPFAERSQEEVYALVVERVVKSKVVDTWSLTDSLLRRSEIETAMAQIPNGTLLFRSWVNGNFLTSPQSSEAQFAGIRTAFLGSLWVILLTLLVALPIGVGAAIYLEEYAGDSWLNRLIETNINNLAGVPSIIYGMLGLAIFVRAFDAFTSGSIFGIGDETTANGRTILSASLTLALLVLPLVIINAREAIRAAPDSLRQAGFGLGGTRWQVIWSHVLPYALPGILTGNILAMSRAIGETAPLVVVGASTFIAIDPSGPFSKFTTLPVQIYQWTARPQEEFRNIAAAAILVLLALLLTLNATAVLLRNRYSKSV
jgi:phosphate transport system permease protein